MPVVTEPESVRSTRSSYDTLADAYVEHLGGWLTSSPWERAVLAVFAELVAGGPVVDVGCGAGEATGYLHGLGADVFGVDLSPGMLAQARRAHPDLRFEVGSMLGLDLPDASVAGLSACYSTIHIADELLPDVFAEFSRVLAPGGHLLLAFQVGDEPQHYAEAWGHRVALTFHRRRPDVVAGLLVDAGLSVRSRTVREPGEGERTAHAHLVARKDG